MGRHGQMLVVLVVLVDVQSLSTLKVMGTQRAPIKVEQLGQCLGLQLIRPRTVGGSYGHTNILL